MGLMFRCMDWVSIRGRMGGSSLGIIRMGIGMGMGSCMIRRVGCSRRLGDRARLLAELCILIPMGFLTK